jgi:hypothetical protein
MSQNSWTLSSDDLERPSGYLLPHRPDACQRPESAFFTHLTLNKPYNSNRTPLEVPSTERWAPLCCSPSRHECWTWRQTRDCSTWRTIAGSFDTPYVKATGVGREHIVTRLYVKTCFRKIHQSPQFVAQNCNEGHQTENHRNCSRCSRGLGSYVTAERCTTTAVIPRQQNSGNDSDDDDNNNNYSFTLSVTPWSNVLLEKLTGFQLVKKFPTFYRTQRFITAFTSTRHLSLS